MGKDIIILDVESTGLLEPSAIKLNKQPFMTEIYAARFSSKGKFVGEVEHLINVPIEIPKHITKITGIDNSMLSGQPEFAEIYNDLVELFLGARIMVAHNLSFDAGMLWVELSRMGREFHFPWCPEWYCTIEHSMCLTGKMINLSTLHEHATGEPHKDGAHRAKQDVMALHRCYNWMIENEM